LNVVAEGDICHITVAALDMDLWDPLAKTADQRSSVSPLSAALASTSEWTN
jgi:hypothetical protein